MIYCSNFGITVIVTPGTVSLSVFLTLFYSSYRYNTANKRHFYFENVNNIDHGAIDNAGSPESLGVHTLSLGESVLRGVTAHTS